jgi:ribosomal protein S18 acetylase RimI-like enzyme
MVDDVIIRQLEESDFGAYKALFDEAYSEYLEFLRRGNPTQYTRELKKTRTVSRARFDFYLKTGSCFVADENSEVVGYVASQTVPFMRGFDRLLWIEYIVVQKSFRRLGIGFALLRRLIEHAKAMGIGGVSTTINPDNEASVGLHVKAGFDVKDWKSASYDVDG